MIGLLKMPLFDLPIKKKGIWNTPLVIHESVGAQNEEIGTAIQMLLSEVKSLTLNLPTLLKEVIETTYNPHFSLVFLGLALAMMYQVEAKKMKDKKLFSQTSWVKHSYPLFPLPSPPLSPLPPPPSPLSPYGQ